MTSEHIARFYFTFTLPGHQKRFEDEMRFLLWIIIRLLKEGRDLFLDANRGRTIVSTNTNDFENVPLLFRKIL